MRKTIVAACAATALLAMPVFSANADLLQPLVAGPGDAPTPTPVREGCGFGGHRGFLGGCRANRGPRGAVFAYRHDRPGYFYRHRHPGYFYRHY